MKENVLQNRHSCKFNPRQAEFFSTSHPQPAGINSKFLAHLLSHGSYSVLPGTVELVSPGTVLEKQIMEPTLIY